MKKAALRTLQFLMFLLMGAMVLIDRLICAFNIWQDMPGYNEINELDHEKNAFINRMALWIILGALVWFIVWMWGSSIFSFFSNLFF